MEKLKFGGFDETLSKVKPEDLEANMSAGFIINAPLGSLVHLRQYLEFLFGPMMKYYRHSAYHLYVVDWYGMSDESKKGLKKSG